MDKIKNIKQPRTKKEFKLGMGIKKPTSCMFFILSRVSHALNIFKSLKGGEITTIISQMLWKAGVEGYTLSQGDGGETIQKQEENNSGSIVFVPASPLGDLIPIIPILLKKFNLQVYLVKNSIHG